MPSNKDLVIRYPNPDRFLDDFGKRGPLGVLFVETNRRMRLNETVTILLEFPTRGCTYRMRGRVVTSRRAGAAGSLPPGVQVEFSYDQFKTMHMVLDCAEGKMVDFVQRTNQRMPCQFEVSYRSNAGFVREFADDISEGGSFIRTDRPFPAGTEVECKLKPPGYLLGVKLRGRVVWVQPTGDMKGMGIEFIFDSERQRNKVKEVVRKLSVERGRQLERTVDAFRKKSR